MKKFISIFATCMLLLSALFSATSCKDSNYEMSYMVTVVGDADGVFELVFPNGDLKLDGIAGVDFNLANDSTLVKKDKAILYSDALYANDETLNEAAQMIENLFVINSLGGSYDVRIIGYVMEPITGVTLSIDREFTNR